MKTWWFLILLVALGLPVPAQETLRADTNTAAEDEIRKVELDLAQTMIRGEWDSYAAHLMDDYERAASNGTTENKAAVMTHLRSGSEKVLDLTPEELKIRVYGDTAILTGHFTLVQRRNGRVDTYFTRETEVFLRRNGRWLLATEHATTVAK
jgi:ketosteroid isomerase-like protein